MECKMEDAILLDCYISSKDGKHVADIGFIRGVLPVWPRRVIAGQIVHMRSISLCKPADIQRIKAAKVALTNNMRMFERTPFGNDRFEVSPEDIIREYEMVGVSTKEGDNFSFIVICKRP